MKKGLLAILILISSQLFAQSVREQLETKLKASNNYDDLEVSQVVPTVYGDLEVATFQIAVPFAAGTTDFQSTVVLSRNTGQKLINDKVTTDFNLLSGDLIKGKVVYALPKGDNYVLLTHEVLKFQNSEREYYRAYLVNSEQTNLQRLPLEDLGYKNELCLDQNKDLDYELFAEGDKIKLKKSVTSIDYENCEPEKKVKTSIFYFDPRRTQFVNEKNSLVFEVDRNIKLAGTIWQVKDEYVNSTKQKRNSAYEFDDQGRIILWNRKIDGMTMSSQFIGTYEFADKKATINYQYDGMETAFSGNIFQNETTLIWEAVGVDDERIFSLSFNSNRAVFQEDISFVRELYTSGWEPGILHFVNCLYSDRVDLIELFLEKGFDPHEYANLHAGDSIMTGSALFMTVLTSNLDALKVMVESGADIYDKYKNHSFISIFELAKQVGDKDVIDYLSPYEEDIMDYYFPRENKNELYQWTRDFFRIPKNEGHIEVSWYHEEADILYYNISASLCESNMNCSVDEDVVVYYRKDRDGKWITKGDETSFPLRVPGEADTIFDLSGKKYMSYYIRDFGKERVRNEYGLRMLNEETGIFEKTNLSYTEYQSVGKCDPAKVNYVFRPKSTGENQLEVVKNIKNYVACKNTETTESVTTYHWSERQSRFIETID